MKSFDLLDGVLMKIDHLELFQALKVFNFGDTVALKPNTFDVCKFFQILNSLESFVVKVKGIVESWSGILSVLLTEIPEVSISDNVVTIFVLVHLNDNFPQLVFLRCW